jgi:hypothetical protein
MAGLPWRVIRHGYFTPCALIPIKDVNGNNDPA